MLGRTWRKGKPRALLVESKLVQPTTGNSTEVPQEIKNKTTKRPSNPTSEYISRRNEILI